ncbi:zymogen granule membrane protein 16-like [Engraulis encrasicolus]|uniref:zymogen granule membrane protein 16-like n=1 Tax=Engraulis encrasicolus TaxID=184585 RepID=UPI002FD4FDD0
MQTLLYLCVFLTAVNAAPAFFSFSPAVGSGSGSSYLVEGMGRITAVKIWENYNGHIRGIQLRYGFAWAAVAGYITGEPLEMELDEGEFFVQISGKYAHYIQSLQLVTNRGRSITAGQPSGGSFNMYGGHPQAELRFLSGRVHGGLTSLASHWAVLDKEDIPNNSYTTSA